MYRPLFLTVLMLALGFLTPAHARTAETWKIVQSAGDVIVTADGDQRVAIDPRAALPEGTIVTTGQSGRAVIRRGQEQIILQPRTRLVLTGATPSSTHFLQSTGSALYRIGKKQAPHFQVDTPYLGAIVKGTVFSVTVSGSRTDVAVTEGAVEVSSKAGAAVTLVKPGMTASVSAADTREINLQDRSGNHRLITTNEGGWASGGQASNALLRTGTDTRPTGIKTNLSGLRDSTIGLEVTSTSDHEALRLSAVGETASSGTSSAEFPKGMGLRQSLTSDLAAGDGKTASAKGFGTAAQDAATAMAGKVDSAVRSMGNRKPLKVSAEFPWNALFMCLLLLLAMMIVSHIRSLQARTKKLESRN